VVPTFIRAFSGPDRWHTGCTRPGVTLDEMGSNRRVVASSWRHLDDLLFQGSWNPRLGRHRSPNAFRGDNRCNRSLQTGLMRLGGDTGAKERHLIRNYRKYARRSFVGDDSVWNWLALAQHHGLPTRLLDWTYSPYVALHFVTARPQAMDVDGEVWIMDVRRVHEELPGALRDLLRAEGSDVFTGEMLSRVTDSLDGLVELAEEPFALFLEPPSLDDRIINQAALFSLMSTQAAQLGDWLEDRPEAVRRVVIPADLKWEVRDRLDQINLTERVLFPGLDGLSEWLARYYRER
jgi:hypothetical protein